MVTNSLLPRLHVGAPSANSSAARSPSAATENTKTYPKQQFIPGDGIDVRVLRAYIAFHYGDHIDLRSAINTTDGKEGFLVRISAPIEPDTVQRLQEETKNLRDAEQKDSQSRHFDKLYVGWTQHQHYLDHEAQLQDVNKVPTHRIDRNLPIPFLDLPPKYDDIEGLHSHRRSIQASPITLDKPKNLTLRRRPVSCSDLDYFGPSGGFYPDGYNGSEGELPDGLTFARVYGPPDLPDITPAQDSDLGVPRSNDPEPHNTRNLYRPWQGHSGPGTRDPLRHIAPLTRARSTTSLHSSHYGFAHQPSQRLAVPGREELFFVTPETPPSPHGSSQQVPQHKQNYSDGRPAWA